MSDSVKAKIFLFGSDKLTLNQNNKIFFHVQQYIKISGALQFLVINDPAVSNLAQSFFFSPLL